MMLAVTTAALNLKPVLDPLIECAGLILTGIVAWVAARVARYAHVSTQSALFQNLLGAVDRGIAYAQAKALVADSSVSVSVPAVAADAADYVVTKMPGTLNSLGITPQHVADLVLARLPTVTAAPAVTVAPAQATGGQ